MKRSTLNALRLEARVETNIYELAEELADGSYKPTRSIRFAVERPKLREIVAADFRDRVVHHYLVERLEKIHEPIFIHDSYACRTGKGVHAALQRVRDFMRKGTKNGTIPLYALHLDVKNFFTSIDKRILAELRDTIRQFLYEKLHLQLNTRYAAITDVRNGIDFIGYIIPFVLTMYWCGGVRLTTCKNACALLRKSAYRLHRDHLFYTQLRKIPRL
ncbi:MAG: hypothetical protein PHN84_03075 [Desulfuromonadaceae bacterium]|nr:hypothetical protein [Desulfuromonadaceae bacterium]MDD2856338.1 hypothetical protein [Desulfuromonadaceae bacterium]